MWQLSVRGQTPNWTDLGTFPGIGLAARRVLELEGDPTPAIFFRVFADPTMDTSDADILSRLEYQGVKGFYLLTRRVN